MINYDINYYENLLKRYSKTAEEISKIRWDWVKDANAKTVLDYGCGAGWFRAYRNGAKVDTYDIMDVPQTGITRAEYDLICFWDVLEHIKNLSEIENIIKKAKYIAATIPVKPNSTPMTTWKHFKIDEHFHYFSDTEFIFWLKSLGFNLIKLGDPECPPREDIHSFLFKRGQNET